MMAVTMKMKLRTSSISLLNGGSSTDSSRLLRNFRSIGRGLFDDGGLLST